MSTTTENVLFADWLQKSLSFPEPGYRNVLKNHQIACWIELSASKLLVQVHTKVRSQHLTAALKQRWVNGIKEAWNGKFYLEADTAPGQDFYIPLSAPGTETPAVLRSQSWHAPIEFLPTFYGADEDGAPEAQYRSDDIMGIIDPNVHRGSTKYWWGKDKDNGETVEHLARHEFGHFIGAADEYHLYPDDFESVVGRAPTPDESMVLKDGTPTGRFSTLNSIMGLFTFQPAHRRHAELFPQWLNEVYVPRQNMVTEFRLKMHDEIEEKPVEETPVSDEWDWYTIKEDDWLSLIAERYGMTWDELYNYAPTGEPNRLLLESNSADLIYPGEMIRVPVQEC